jgi:hypothetical protein
VFTFLFRPCSGSNYADYEIESFLGQKRFDRRVFKPNLSQSRRMSPFCTMSISAGCIMPRVITGNGNGFPVSLAAKRAREILKADHKL